MHRAEKASGLFPFRSKLEIRFNLLKTLVQRDLEARYKGSLLGNLWPLVNQLSQLLIYTYVFSIVLKVKLNIQGLPDSKMTYGLWLFAGLLPWMGFSSGLGKASVSVITQQNLVKKVVFPLTLLPLVPVLSAFLESLFGFFALLVMVSFTTQTIQPTVLLMPLAWIPQLLLTAGLAYLAAAFTVFLRDIPQSLDVILNFWFYLTPIVYPSKVIPEFWRVWVFRLNPLAGISEAYRDFIIVGKITHGHHLIIATVISIIVFWVGLSVYKKLRPAFADVL